MSDLRGLFKWGSQFGHEGDELHPNLKKAILKGIGEIEDIVAGYVLSEKQRQAIETAEKIQKKLNANEAAYPRRDPALRGLDTAQWKVYAYVNLDSNGKQKRNPNGQYDFKFRFVAINMQKPFYYKFDFTDYTYRYGGKVLLNTPIYALTDREREKLFRTDDYRHLPTGYTKGKRKYKQVTKFTNRLSSEGYANTKGDSGLRVMSRRVGYVGNLAAVRLATKGGIVKTKHAKKIVFWVGHAKKLNGEGKAVRGNRLGVGGYVFVNARMYNIGGHDRYKREVNNIINSEINTFMDTLW